ncbi:hypothetical protein [Amphritea sp.]|uniref:hypothetical protein n=1 Tax=Amphritea sp. TaxID=1872502 RepID=UPI0025C3DB6D|nr:hypothetical protein [Amphritea sp.]
MKKHIFYLCVFFLCGCSVLAYTPVVATSGLGLNKTDLSESQEFQEFINQPFRLTTLGNTPWQLKKFGGGRYHIELAISLSKKEVICELGAKSIVIDKIFDDSINGGIFYSAKVTCNDHVYNAPLNRWSDRLRNSIEFIGNNS